MDSSSHSKLAHQCQTPINNDGYIEHTHVYNGNNLSVIFINNNIKSQKIRVEQQGKTTLQQMK